MKWFCLCFAILLFSCNGDADHAVQRERDGDSVAQAHEPAAEPSTASDSTLRKGDTLVRTLTLPEKNVRVETSFVLLGGDSLHVQLISENPRANIRIAQIERPDSTFDGPFGKELSYPIKQHGRYTIIAAPNMMAEGPWSGDFDVKAWVQ